MIKHAKVPDSSNLFLKSFKVTKYGINVESALQHILRRKIPMAPITWFVGDNGIGKSMLLASLYAGCGLKLPWWCKHDWGDKIKITVERNVEVLRQAKAKGTGEIQAFYMPLSDKVNKGYVEDILDATLKSQSLGQKFIMMIEPLINDAKSGEPRVIFIDDIDAGLSMRTQKDFATRLKKGLKNSNMQLIAVTHSPILIETVGGHCLDFDDDVRLKTVAEYMKE